VLFFFTGLHTDYHRPSDTWDKINYDGEAQILDIVERSVRTVADASARITFADGAEKPSAKVTSGGFKVSLGVIPDYSDDPQGLRIDGVRAGTPAEKAGVQAGDILTQIGSTKVKNIYDLTAALSTLEPNTVVDLVVLRDGKEVKMKATLTGR
jgi:S1-C subfamily serine protease